VSRVALQTGARAGTVALADGYRTASGLKLGLIGRARPTKLSYTPAVFVDTVVENTDAFTTNESQRTVRVGLRCVWGAYDAGPTVDARDKFVDGFYAYVMDHANGAFGANTGAVAWIGTADDEDWTPGWMKPEDQPLQPMFSTLITLEGFAST
jgi:hypothetical protein